jgi:DNA ligase D-like protein (predicted 3'-phosphoesterase)
MKRILVFGVPMDEAPLNPDFAKSESLKSYRKKRNFGITSEPPGEKASHSDQIFVVQKHNARSLHYDLRLAVDGVLKSWAVPKGPSLNPADKRLAIQTEDHPLNYANFEGIIPEGQYGAGTVIVWDKGPYRNITKKDGQVVSIAQALENGHVVVWLVGKKLLGGYALTRTKREWILVKMKDELADSSRDILLESRSVLSGKTVEDMAKK